MALMPILLRIRDPECKALSRLLQNRWESGEKTSWLQENKMCKSREEGNSDMSL